MLTQHGLRSRNLSPPASDHLGLTFGVVTYSRFDCTSKSGGLNMKEGSKLGLNSLALSFRTGTRIWGVHAQVTFAHPFRLAPLTDRALKMSS